MSSQVQQTRLALNEFFIAIQGKALRQAMIATGDKEEAFDIVQQAMMKLTSHYSEQPEAWPQLFQRILQNAIRDWFRKQKLKRLLFWQHHDGDQLQETDTEETYNHPANTIESTPEKQLISMQQLKKIETALRSLPPRQQQVFLLRAWWGNSTEETAYAMACSTGSVKTHYSRALSKLKTLLEYEQ